MTTVSGFTFIHNGIEGGYPFVEAIQQAQPFVDNVFVVDMESTDGTREILEQMNVEIVSGFWGNEAGKTLREAHNRHIKCSGDVIIHFEADEVYDTELLWKISELIDLEVYNISVHRLQLEQNFQRCRWYPEPTHRVFPKWQHTRKEGHTTDMAHLSYVIPPEAGLLWDITNCFRDNWFNRVKNQAELRDTSIHCVMTPIHVMHQVEIEENKALMKLKERHWTWAETPFRIPDALKNLVGLTKYDPMLNLNLKGW
jgi:hypothetical protein